MRVLIAGCGYVGRALGRRLQSEDHEVLGLRRHPRGDEGFPMQALDLNGTWSSHDLPWLPDAVVYAVSAGETSETAYRAAYVQGPDRLLRELARATALARHPLRRFFFVSSTGVYGQQDGSWVDEDSATEPAGYTGRLLLEGEALVQSGPFAATTLRLGGIYGPGRTRLLESVREGRARWRGGRFSNRIHRDDAAGALAWLVAAIESPEPVPLAPVYLGVDDEPAELGEVMTWLAARLGVEPPLRTEKDADMDLASRRRSNKRCSNRLLRATGFELRYPSYREGYGALLEEVRSGR